MTKQNIIFIATPFILTAVFLSLGYQVLIRATPQASIAPLPPDAQVEIIQDGDIEPVAPSAPLPASSLSGPVHSIPDNKSELVNLLSQARANNHQLVYLTIPATLSPDLTLELSNVHQSSQENIIRWTKRTINALHQSGLHVVLALTLNASQVIDDPQTFAVRLSEFATPWASIANEFGVDFFVPGITVGHPVYSKLSNADLSRVIINTERSLRQTYSGRIGTGLCCTLNTTVNTAGSTFVVLIPTPEFTFEDLETLSQNLQSSTGLRHLFFYDLNQKIITTTSPLANPSN